MTQFAKRLDILHKSGKTVFSTSDLGLLWGIENRNVLRVRIARAVAAKYLESIQRGLYALTGVAVNVYELSGKLQKNSYISFETALADNGALHQWYGAIYAAAPRSCTIQNKYGTFVYVRMPEKVLANRAGIVLKKGYAVAIQERALLDSVYVHGIQHFDIGDINGDVVREVANVYGTARMKRDAERIIKRYGERTK
jgi:predicted transcriptional regulator of viral defense system